MQQIELLTPAMIAEIEFLLRYDPFNHHEGLKVHHDASFEVREAAQRLYEKGLISQPDGGYLTDRGVEAAELLQRGLGLLDWHARR